MSSMEFAPNTVFRCFREKAHRCGRVAAGLFETGMVDHSRGDEWPAHISCL